MNKEAAMFALTEAIESYRAYRRYADWCDGLLAAKKAAGVYDRVDYDTDLSIAVEQVYTAVNPTPKRLSDRRMSRMFGAAYRAAVLADLDPEPGAIREIVDLTKAIAEITAALAKA